MIQQRKFDWNQAGNFEIANHSWIKPVCHVFAPWDNYSSLLVWQQNTLFDTIMNGDNFK